MQRNKTRSDSVLDALPVAARERLDEWLLENKSYAEVHELVTSELGVATSTSAVARYYARHIAPQRYLESIAQAVALMEGPETDFEDAAKRLVGMQLFEALAQPDPDVKTAKGLTQVLATLSRTKVAEARAKLDERRVAVQERLAVVKEQTAAAKGAKRANEAEARTGQRMDGEKDDEGVSAEREMVRRKDEARVVLRELLGMGGGGEADEQVGEERAGAETGAVRRVEAVESPSISRLLSAKVA